MKVACNDHGLVVKLFDIDNSRTRVPLHQNLDFYYCAMRVLLWPYFLPTFICRVSKIKKLFPVDFNFCVLAAFKFSWFVIRSFDDQNTIALEVTCNFYKKFKFLRKIFISSKFEFFHFLIFKPIFNFKKI